MAFAITEKIYADLCDEVVAEDEFAKGLRAAGLSDRVQEHLKQNREALCGAVARDTKALEETEARLQQMQAEAEHTLPRHLRISPKTEPAGVGCVTIMVLFFALALGSSAGVRFLQDRGMIFSVAIVIIGIGSSVAKGSPFRRRHGSGRSRSDA